VLEEAPSPTNATPFHFGSRPVVVLTDSGPAANEASCRYVRAGLIAGYLSQGDAALTVIYPVTVGCPNNPDAPDVIFVEGTTSEFRDDVSKMTGTSGCPGAQPT
jgi:hypothetical protein